jgi:hypothetical protein
MVLEDLKGRLRERHRDFAHLPGGAEGEVLGEEGDVFLAFPERRHDDRVDVEPVIQIAAELPFFNGFDEVLVGRGDDAHVDLLRGVGADGLNGLLLDAAQDLRLERQRHVPDFVEEQRAAVGLCEAPLAVAGGARERASGVAEQLAFEELFGDGGAVDGHEGGFGPRAAVVDGLGHDFLAGAGFAGDEHVGAARRDFPDVAQQGEVGRALPDELPGRGGLELFAQIPVVPPERVIPQRAGDGGFEGVELERLHRVVERPFLDDLHSLLERGVGGHDHHGQIRVGGLDLFHQLAPAQPRKPEIAQDEVHFPFFEYGQRFLGRFRRDRAVAHVFEGYGQHFQKVRFVVDDEDCIHDSAVCWDSIACEMILGCWGEAPFPEKLLPPQPRRNGTPPFP